MTAGRRKLIGLAALAVLAGAVILAGTQTWFAVTIDAQTITVGGVIAAGALVPLALAVLVLVAALAIAGPVFRLVLSVLAALLGVCISLQAGIAIGDPVTAAQTAIADATGVSGAHSAAALVDGVAQTAWPTVALIAGILIVVVSIAVLISSRAWPVTGRRYERTRLETEDGQPMSAVDEWDALSHGDDPTEPSR